VKTYDYATQPKRVREHEIDPAWKIVDLFSETILELGQGLIPGTELYEKFEAEKLHAPSAFFHYPQTDEVVMCADEFWHICALLLRNSTLIRSSHGSSWLTDRNHLINQVVAVAGCSVGSMIAHSLAFDMRPRNMKLADGKPYHLSNANRVQLRHGDIGRNKAVVTAEAIHAIDPFMKMSVYQEGITEQNVTDFVVGNDTLGELAASIIIEETDNPKVKILIREKARKHRVPVVMVSDLGSAVLVDVRRFDLDSTISLLPEVSDDAVYEMLSLYERSNEEEKGLMFQKILHMFVGDAYRAAPEFESIMFGKEKPLFKGSPQLGSTVAVAAGFAAETAWRILLGYSVPERRLVHKYK